MRWIAAPQCTDHEDCIKDPLLGIRCAANKERPDIRPLAEVLFPPCERLPFPKEACPPAMTFLLSAPSSIVCRPRRLVVSADCAQHFEIESLTIGHYEQISYGAAAIAIPASAWSESAFPTLQDFPILRPGMLTGIRIRNTSDVPRVFVAWFEIERADDERARQRVAGLVRLGTPDFRTFATMSPPRSQGFECPRCGALADLHYRGLECVGCERCYQPTR